MHTIIKTQGDLTGLVMDSEQELISLWVVMERNNGDCDVGTTRVVYNTHVETIGSEEVLEVGTILQGCLGLRNDVLESDVVIGDINAQIIMESVRADLGGHLKYSRRWSGVRAGVLLGAQGAVHRGENRGGL